MVRIIGIALVILGLVAQPLIAAMPGSMPISDASVSMPMDHASPDIGTSDNDSMSGDQSAGAPCHETTVEDSAPMPCTDCDSDCASGSCESACSLTNLAVLDQSLLKFGRSSIVRGVGISGALVEGLPSRIFHPPKHA